MPEQQSLDEEPRLWKTLAGSLWFPALFFFGFLLCYMLPFHSPRPHDVKVAVSGPVEAARIQAGLEEKMPGAFDISAVNNAQEARQAVENRDTAAAFALKGDSATLYVAKANGLTLESAVTPVFTTVSQQQGARLTTVDVAPVAQGDATGTGLFYLALAWNIAPYIAVMMLLRATSLGRVAKLTTLVAVGAAMSAIAYAVARGMDVIPNEPLAMLYGFLLTQAVAWTVYGLVPFARQYVVGVAITLFVLFSVPSSGGAIPYQMVPAFFRRLHPVLPLGNFLDATRGLFYFDGKGMLRPTVVLLVWMAVGAALIGVGALLQKRKMEAEEGAGEEGSRAVEPAEEARVEDASIEAPVPQPVQHSAPAAGVPILQGLVTEPDGTPVVGAAVTVTDQRGHRLVRTHTDPSGWYAVTGLPENFVNVLLTAPDQIPAVARVLPVSGHPRRQDFILSGKNTVPPERPA